MTGEKEINVPITNNIEFMRGQRDGQNDMPKKDLPCFDYRRGYKKGKHDSKRWKEEGLK